MRTKEDYYDILEQITNHFGDVALIPVKAVAEYLGKNEQRLRQVKDFPYKKIGGRYFITPTALARWLS